MTTTSDTESVGEPVVHTVEVGEHAAAIASRYGFASFAPIWQSEANEELRSRRKDPLQLVAGDKLVIPERIVRRLARATGRWHDFTVQIPKLKLKLKLCDSAGAPLEFAACVLRVDGVAKEIYTDQSGFIESEIRSDAKQADLEVMGQTYKLAIGQLDPNDVDSGNTMRLRNLGYLDVGEDGCADEGELRQSLREFQQSNGLTVTGEFDQPTRDTLAKLHGC
jgi:hypothetical protein